MDGTLSCGKCSSEESLPTNNNNKNSKTIPNGCSNCTSEKSTKKDKNRRHSHEWSGGCKKNKKKGGSSCECDSTVELCNFATTKKVVG